MPSKEPVKTRKFRCPACLSNTLIRSEYSPTFCPHCGYKLIRLTSMEENGSEAESASVSYVNGLEPAQASIQYSIGPYKIFRSIGKGGMGEVLLAYDTICGRQIALKRIRPDLLSFKQITSRFLKEARVTSQLTHPAIIPIYSIHQEEDYTYYTMPYVEGETLKQILRNGRQAEKKGEKSELMGTSIPALLRIFLSICQAVAYAHSKSILHRDLKPENIIVGKYGQVMILDWGLAKLYGEVEKEYLETEDISSPLRHMTQIGKVVGTVGYMAPERAMGNPADKMTDIYSLGVILYQILTLRLPFKRSTLKEFREKMEQEVLHDPIAIAPYRDIPKMLSQIVLKSLAKEPANRYESVDSLIHDLENYLEGKAEWFQAAELSVKQKSDWEFQEHILIAEHTAITRTAEISEWVRLMISKASFAENIRIETQIFLHEKSQGIGFLFNVPEITERAHINDGYCLWISAEISKPTRLLRSSIEVLAWPELSLKKNEWHAIRLEKMDKVIRLWVDGVEQLSYISHMPLTGTHMGILARDTHYEIQPLHIFISSQNVMVNCLAIPDAFLAKKNYHQALSEYRRISYSFAGRAESREAVLRSGITLIEQAKNSQSAEETTKLYDTALSEFEKLHSTAGAPLEYLGKSLVYKAQNDVEEEVKCLELAYRRFPHHPLLTPLKDQILFRLIESSQRDRKAAYHFLLLTLTRVPDAFSITSVNQMTAYLKKHWETVDFFCPSNQDDPYGMIIPLAFWLHKNYVLEEATISISKQEKDPKNFMNAILALVSLKENATVIKLFNQLPKSQFQEEKLLLSQFLDSNQEIPINPALSVEVLDVILDRALDDKNTSFVHQYYAALPKNKQEKLLAKELWALLMDRNYKAAGHLFEAIPFEKLTQETSILHFLYGCWLHAVESAEIAKIHWSSVLEIPFPPSWALAAHYLAGKLDPGWFKKAFDWERWQLQRQLSLFKMLVQ